MGVCVVHELGDFMGPFIRDEARGVVQHLGLS